MQNADECRKCPHRWLTTKCNCGIYKEYPQRDEIVSKLSQAETRLNWIMSTMFKQNPKKARRTNDLGIRNPNEVYHKFKIRSYMGKQNRERSARNPLNCKKKCNNTPENSH
jgi:hypothetical protein